METQKASFLRVASAKQVCGDVLLACFFAVIFFGEAFYAESLFRFEPFSREGVVIGPPVSLEHQGDAVGMEGPGSDAFHVGGELLAAARMVAIDRLAVILENYFVKYGLRGFFMSSTFVMLSLCFLANGSK